MVAMGCVSTLTTWVDELVLLRQTGWWKEKLSSQEADSARV